MVKHTFMRTSLPLAAVLMLSVSAAAAGGPAYALAAGVVESVYPLASSGIESAYALAAGVVEFVYALTAGGVERLVGVQGGRCRRSAGNDGPYEPHPHHGPKSPASPINNPDVLTLTPLSPNQIQISAKATGVTQVNLWGEDRKLHTIDVIVYGDAQELAMILRTTFPKAVLKVVPVSNAVLISGFVDKAEHIARIVQIAEEYYPKVINNMTVGGVQQVLLHVKVMEVSRTKLRQLGFDFAKITGSNVVASGVSGLLSNALNNSTAFGRQRSPQPARQAPRWPSESSRTILLSGACWTRCGKTTS